VVAEDRRLVEAAPSAQVSLPSHAHHWHRRGCVSGGGGPSACRGCSLSTSVCIVSQCLRRIATTRRLRPLHDCFGVLRGLGTLCRGNGTGQENPGLRPQRELRALNTVPLKRTLISADLI